MFDWLVDSFKTPERCETFGSPTDEGRDGGYAGITTCYDDNGMPTGQEYGVGLLDGDAYDSPDAGPTDLSSGYRGKEGAWIDAEGDRNRGAVHEGGLLSFASPELLSNSVEREDGSTYEEYGGFEFDLLHGKANAHIDEGDGAALGLGFNLASIGLTTGSRGSDADTQSRLAVSAGPSADARLHWGDEDKDGHNEYGFGFDAGWASFDYKTEDPIRSYLKAASMGSWDGGEHDPERSNMTQGVVDGHDSLTDSIAGVEDTQGSRGGAKTFGSMGPVESTMHALFNEGMNDEARAKVLDERVEAATSLFGGMFD